MSNRDFLIYPKVVYLLLNDYGDWQSHRFYTDRTFALKARRSNGAVFEMAMPALKDLKVVDW